MKCYYCNSELTEQELEEWSKSERCCSGLGEQCGCMGMPIDPPVCHKCVTGNDENKELLEEVK